MNAPWQAKDAKNKTPEECLEELRTSIDNLDAALIYILSERFKCTKKVGFLKKSAGMPARDSLRERHQIARLRELAVSAELDPDFAEKLLEFILKEVIQNHLEVLSS